MPITFVLASASPARLRVLRGAGVFPEVVVSGVDEDEVQADSPAELAGVLAEMKAKAVASNLTASSGIRRLVLGCDSVLEFDGVAYGKPADAEEAAGRWRAMRGGTGTLHTGHSLVDGDQQQTEIASTVVRFADITDAEIEAYVATGEPMAVAGAFTLDGLAGPFVESVEGDPHNVIGLSLPLLRRMVRETGLEWTDLWPAPEDPFAG